MSGDVVGAFWAAMKRNDWRAAAGAFVEGIVIDWPCSGERIVGRADSSRCRSAAISDCGRLSR